ncbi:Dyp-type peroxidase [Thermobifida cellulosilytica]|uniref:Peroxidase n=1 Tax=Thermobifida cellulosilytica TB100 TaxID=665004 RepID=A0A147KIM3_THECS|nr:Dyp-type peroxidase [Thermobifida cellulosilytica]KUP97143.1 peroxidase [Thermobifida cellulosilytica TB100]
MTGPEPTPAGSSRRGFLAGLGAAALTGAGLGMAAGEAVRPLLPDSDSEQPDPVDAQRLDMARRRADANAAPQPGISGRAPAFVHVIAFDLAEPARAEPAAAREGAATALRTWAEHAARLHADGPEGAASAGLLPASLMVTIGIGGSLLEAMDAADRRPDALADLPEFATDDLRPRWCGGDLMLQVGAEDPMVLAAAVDELVAATAPTTTVRWSLRGFRRTAAAAQDPDATPRNLMGQIDGTANPAQDHPLFTRTVTAPPADDPAHAWMDGGSYLVVRRIRMLLDEWRRLDVPDRERVIGRHLDTGAPLGGEKETDPVVLTARDADGRLVIPEDAHVRLANPENNLGARMVRRGYNYDEGWRDDGVRDAGLLFMAWQGNPATGFVPVQRSLVEQGDALNRYTRHEGSALFAVPAATADRYPGQDLVEG